MSRSLALAALALALPLAACASADPTDDPSIDDVGEAEQGQKKPKTPEPFDVEFTGCRDVAGITPIPLANAEALVPNDFTIQTPGATASFVVRLANCDGIAVENGPAKPGTVVQVGITIVPPDGNTANLNNYTGWYYTDHKALAKRLENSGMRAQYVKHLDFDYDPDPAGTGGALHVDVPGEPAFELDGQVGEPTVAPTLYRAVWWQDGKHGVVELDTVLPAIAFGTAPVLDITTDSCSEIADLIGGTSAPFTAFHSFSRSTPELMHVSVAP